MKSNEKKYQELSDMSTTNKIESSSLNQTNKPSLLGKETTPMNEGKKKRFFTYQNNSSILTTSSSGGSKKGTNSQRKKTFIINTDEFKIWHDNKVKCVSYHGIEYLSSYNPKNDTKNLYIRLGKDGNFIPVGDEEMQDFNYDDFVMQMNSLVNSNGELTSIIRRSKCLNILLNICLSIILFFFSAFIFYISYSLILKFIANIDITFNYQFYIIAIVLINIILLLLVLYGLRTVEAKKFFSIFSYLQTKKDTVQAELAQWNQKTFSLINKKAVLADNFDYIHIKYE